MTGDSAPHCRRGADEENEMNRNLKILVLLVTLSLVSAFAFAPTAVLAAEDPPVLAGGNSGHLITSFTESDGSDDGSGTGDGGALDGDPDDTGGGFGAREDLYLWDTEYEGQDLEAVERWLLFLMLQVLPTP